MNAARTLRRHRMSANVSQSELAALTGTSQATISAYETGAKQPSLRTFSRLLAATGTRLTVVPERVAPTSVDQEEAARRFAQVLELAESLPSRRRGQLRYPRLPTTSP